MTKEAPVPAAGARRSPVAPVALVGWVAFSLLVLYAVLLGGGWLGIYVAPLRDLSLVLTGLGLLGWAVLAWRQPRWRPATAIWPALVAPLAILLMSVILSRFGRLGLEYVAWSVLLAALYLLLVRILALPFARARIGALAAMIGLVLGCIYVGWVVGLWIEWWGLLGRIEAPPLRPMYAGLTWGNPSAVLTVQVLLLLVALAGLGTATRGTRMTLLALSIVTVVVTVLSGSRAGWLALAGAGVLVGGLWLLGSRRRASMAQAIRQRRVQVALVVIGAVAIVVAVVLTPGVVARIEGGGDGGRLTYFATALRMFAEAPLLGTGPGTWAARRIAFTETGELDFYIPHAHNVYLHTLAELGIAGLLAGLVALGAVAWLLARAIRGSDPVRRRWGWASLFGFLYLGLHSYLDYYSNMPAVLLLLVIPVAFLDATSDRRLGLPAAVRPAATMLARAAVAVLAIGCIVSVVLLARFEAIALTHQQAVESVNDADWSAAVGPARNAVAEDSDLPPYRVTLGLAAAGTGDWPAAAAAFGAAAAVDDLPQSWLGLARAQVEMGESAEVVAPSLERAFRIGVQQPAVAYGIGLLYDRIGLTEAADAAYLAALTGLPSLASDPSWTADPLAAARFERLIERALEERRGTWELALMAGQVDRARALAEASADPAFAQAIIAAWGGDRTAASAIRDRALDAPFDPVALAWAARVSSHQGNQWQADRFRRLVEIGVRGAPEGVEVRIGTRQSPRDAAIGTRTPYYGNYMYRRTTPWDLMVPGMPGLVIEGLGDEPADAGRIDG